MSDFGASARINPVPVESPLRARTGAGAAGARIQGAALAAAPRIAATEGAVIQRLNGWPGNQTTADLPGVPWRPRAVSLDPATTAPVPNAPTRTARLNALLGVV